MSLEKTFAEVMYDHVDRGSNSGPRQSRPAASNQAAPQRRELSELEEWYSKGIRNNNPGNVKKLNNTEDAWLGQTGLDGEFPIFDTMVNGIRAAGRNVMTKARQGINTIEGLVKSWSPKSDKNPTEIAIKNISDWMHVTPQQKLDFYDRGTLISLLHAIIRQENGAKQRQLISPEEVEAGVDLALQSAPPLPKK